MAAYAAEVSLKHTIELFLNRSKYRIHLPNSEIELIYKDLPHFLQTISSLQRDKKADNLERQIKLVAEKLEDLIESQLSDRFLSESEGSEDEGLTLKMFSEVKQEIISLTEALETVDQQPIEGDSFLAEAVSSRSIYDGAKKKMVGLDDQLKKLKYWLVAGSYRLDIITITGMAGIGKTTLVEKAYQDSSIVYTFSCRAFVKIGPYSQLRNFLLLFLHQVGFLHLDKICEKTAEELGMELYRFLKGRKYLIVIDGIERTEAWSRLKRFFPNDNIRSRIILTTRLLDFTCRASINRDTVEVPFLSEAESWDLLHEIVFNGEVPFECSSQLEKVGKKIAKNCEGLPLAIIAVGNHLRKTERTVNNWEELEENDNSLIVSSDDYKSIMNTLSSCYKELPPHLKAYFLYMGVFPKDYKIAPSKLTNLWICEGLIEPVRIKSLEEMGKEFLDDLVSRSVVLAVERSTRGGTKTCRLHFVFRNLSVTEAQNERFFHVIKKYANSFPEDTIGEQRRLCIHNNVVLGFGEAHEWMKPVQGARSVLCFGPQQPYPIGLYLHFRLLKVLEALAIRFYEFPHQAMELFHLKYLAITYDGELPPSISFLRNLEVLIVHRHHNIKLPSNAPIYLPTEIWKLHKLKHIECIGSDMPDPSSTDESFILENLLTLSGVSAYSCTQEVLERMCNLQKIGIRIESAHDSLETFDFFDYFVSLYERFETFKCVVTNPRLGSSQVVPRVPNFPVNITKITLSGCKFPWEYMILIEELPNLEVLKLRWYAFYGPMWATSEGGFLKLKFLLLEDLDLQQWEADYEDFPVLTHLIIRNCYDLERIPNGLGHITTLEMIQVDDCSSSLVDSASDIQDEQRDLGSADNIRFEINSSWSDKKDPRFMKK